MKLDKATESRFWDKVMPEPNSGCWLWESAATPLGYGKFSIGGEKTYAHRISYSICIGEIPDGLYVCHKCDNPCCVNPSHLFVGTPKANMQDRDRKGRGYRQKPNPDKARLPTSYVDIDGYEPSWHTVERLRIALQMRANGLSHQHIAHAIGLSRPGLKSMFKRYRDALTRVAPLRR